MRGRSAAGTKKCWWPALAAAAVLLLSAPQALASRTASTKTDLLASPALQPITAAPALAPTYTPQGFALHLDADAHPATFALFNDLAPASERVEPEKLASGVESWALTPNLQRLQIFVTDSRWCREFLGPIDSPNLYQAFGLDPMNMTDPLGLARRTVSGGVNTLGDILNELELSSETPWWQRHGAVALDMLGNTVSDLLMLDVIAEKSAVVGDVSRSTGERVKAGSVGLGVVAVDVAGGAIIGTAGKVLTRLPVVKSVLAKVGESTVGRFLAQDVGQLLRRGAGRSLTEVGAALERRGAAYVRQLGETVIETQYQVGAAARGFDFASFTGTGAEARLVINEAKNVSGSVSPSSFTVFGLGRSGTRTLDRALVEAKEAIMRAEVDGATRQALLTQLERGTFKIRVIGSAEKGTRVAEGTLDLLREATRVRDIELVVLP